MAISKIREEVYERKGEEIRCYECSEILEPEEAFTCDKCSTDFCAEHIHNHEC
jgi:hypothetical protein